MRGEAQAIYGTPWYPHVYPTFILGSFHESQSPFSSIRSHMDKHTQYVNMLLFHLNQVVAWMFNPNQLLVDYALDSEERWLKALDVWIAVINIFHINI